MDPDETIDSRSPTLADPLAGDDPLSTAVAAVTPPGPDRTRRARLRGGALLAAGVGLVLALARRVGRSPR